MRHFRAVPFAVVLLAAILLALGSACDGSPGAVGADESPGTAPPASARAPVANQALGPAVDPADSSARGSALTAPRPPGDAHGFASSVAVPMWSADALEIQPRMLHLQATAPEGMAPGTTSWRRLTLHPAVRAVEALTPGELLSSVLVVQGSAERLGTSVWEQTLRVHRSGEDRATGVALQWGMRDDAVAGSDLRVQMRRRAGKWSVESIEERFHCARGVSGALCN